MKLILGVLLSAVWLMASPCDGTAKIGNNGLTVKCVVAHQSVLDSGATISNPSDTATVSISFLRADTAVLSVDFGFLVDGKEMIKSVLFTAPGNGSNMAVNICLPVGATVQILRIREFPLTNTSSFFN